MNKEKLQLMVTMLHEIEDGTWKPTDLSSLPMSYGNWVAEHGVGFDMITWGGEVLEEDGHSACGFAACAIGHACLDERFTGLDSYDEFGIQPHFHTNHSWTAVAAYLDIDESASRHIFDSEAYSSEEDPDLLLNPVVEPSQVRERIEKLLASADE